MPLYGQAAAGTYRQYADRAAFDVSSITVAVWAKFITSFASMRIASRGDLTANGEWAFGTTVGSAFFFGVRKGGANTLASTGALPSAGDWNHYIGTYNAVTGVATLYKNNVSIATATYAPTGGLDANTTAIRFWETVSGSSHGNLAMAYAGMWGSVLDANDRARLYSGAPPHIVSPDTGVIADLFEKRSIDLAGMEAPTDGGNLQDVPWDLPFRRTCLRPVPGPRNITRRRRALPATGAQTIAPGRASETEEARALTVSAALSTAITRATETEEARSLTAASALAVSLGRVSETESARAIALTSAVAVALGRTSETEEARAISAALATTLDIGRVSETEEARALVAPQVVAIGRASETEEARGLGVEQRAAPSAGGNGDPMRRRLVKIRERELVPAAPVDMLFPVALLCMLEADCLY